MTTVVVPLDGSPFAERALRAACSLAARHVSARVLLVRCAPDDIEDAQRNLDDRASLFASVVEIETRLVATGDPAGVILATAASEPDAVVCMATRGRGRIGTAVLGSVASEVVCQSTTPMVLVGPRCRTGLLPGERGRLLVCSDGSAFSDTVVPTAATWCDRFRLEPWIAEVVGPDENPEPADRPVPNREVEAATKRLEALASRFSTPAGTRVLHGAPGGSIPWFAERLPAAMIAMATHGRGGLTRLAMGSVASEVVRDAACPVLISRPDDDHR